MIARTGIALVLFFSAPLAANPLTWDANGTGSGQTNGGGAWLGTNLWWNGASNQNWVSGSNAIFGGPNTAGGAVTLSSPTIVGSITFNTFTGTYTLGSTGQMLTLNGGLTNNAATGAVTLSSPVTLGASQTWASHSSGALTASALVDTNGHTLAIDGSGATTPSGGITGTGAVVKNGAGRLTLRPGTHDFSGGLALNGGVTMVDGVGADKMGSGNLTLNGGVLEFYWAYTLNRTLGPAAGQMRLPGGESGFSMNGATGSTIRFNNSNTFELVWGGADFNPSALVLNSATSQAGASLTFDNPIDLKGANRTLRSDATAQAVTATMARAISNTGATPAGLIKTGPGLIVLGAANTYNGGTSIDGGTLRFAGLTSMPASGNVALNDGATLGINLGGTGQWTTGTTGHGTLGGLINGLGGQSGSTVSYSGHVGLMLETTGTQVFSPSIPNLGDSLSIVKSGAGTLSLSGNNAYSGKTSIFGGVLEIQSLRDVGTGNSSLGAPADTASGTIAIGSRTTAGTLRYTGGGDTSNRVIELAGTTAGATIEASGTGALVLTSSLAITGTGSKTLTLGGTNTAANAFSGMISNGSGSTISLTKAGAGTWVLANSSNTYTGATNISAGVLQITKLSNGGTASSIGASAGGDGNLLLGDGATLRYTGADDITDRRFRINGTANGHGATLDSSGSGALNFTLIDSPAYGTANQTRTLTLRGTNTGNNILAANIDDNGSGAVSLIKEDPGTWVLTGNSTHSGTTTVNQGTLVVNGSLDASDVIINGGMLAGTATIEGTVNVQAAGTLNPGNSSGTMHAGNVNLGGAFAVELADGESDMEPVLEVDGLLDLTGATLNLNITAGTIQPFYVIATYGTLAGTFATVNGLPSGWTVNYQYGDNNTIAIVPSPPVAVPDQPSGLVAVSGISTDGSTSLIQLDWNAAAGAWSYTIKRALESGGPYTPVASTAQQTYNDLSVLPGQTYYYVVVAENPLGTSPASAEAGATAVAPPPPARPLGLTASNENGIIHLNWQPSAAASGYIVKRSITAGGPYTAIATVSTTSYLETSGVVGTTYHYVVVAVNSGGESPPSDSVSAFFSGDPILAAVDQLKGHITGATPLSAEQIAQASLTLKAQTPRFGESASTIAAVFDLITTFDQVKGALFVTTASGGLTRSAETNDLNWTIYRTMQAIMDVVYTPQNLAAHEALLRNFKFASHTNFPGSCPPPANPSNTHSVPINGSFTRTFGRDTQQWTLPARKPTGTYLAPGTIATVTVPPALVNAGYQIRVGAHSWDLSNRPSIRRLDRATLRFPITSTTVKVASPYGGGIYIEVPIGANAGVVNVTVTGSVRSPYFSVKSFHQTTAAEWAVERNHPAPWADFQSDKFMTQVPRNWIYNHPDPAPMMADWDKAMDAINDLMGFPHIRGKETMYCQVDVIMRSSVHAPGYPAVNVTDNPNTNTYAGYRNNYLVRGPGASPTAAHIEFHEQGHAYFFPKFGGESESSVNLLQPAMLHRKFGYSLDVAHAGSLGSGSIHRTLDNTAVAWMCVFNFSPRNVPMADAEKAYQHKGHAKFLDIVRLYGWSGLDTYWRSFMEDNANGVAYATTTDALLLRLSRSLGRDIRPLFHFWGIHPQNPSALAAAIAAENLQPNPEIRDLLLHYRTLIPANNAAFRSFALNWWGKQPSIGGAWEEREHSRQWDQAALFGANDHQRADITINEEYIEACAAQIRAQVDALVDLYFPLEDDTSPPSPDPMSFAAPPAATSHQAITMTATTASDFSGVEYYFECVSGGGNHSGWQDSPVFTDTGLAPVTEYAYRVRARDKSPAQNTTGWSAEFTARTGIFDDQPPTPTPLYFLSPPVAISQTAITMTAATASDPAGVEYRFIETTGNHSGGWQDSPVFAATGLTPGTTYSFTVTARDKSAQQNTGITSAPASATTLSPSALQSHANSAIAVDGTVAGSLANLLASDTQYYSVTEHESTGNPNSRFSYLEHIWVFNVTGGNTVTFHIEAHHTANTEGDNFVFAYSTSGQNGPYTNMLTVTKTVDDNNLQSFTMPANTSGQIHIRVLDIDRTAGNRVLDTIHIDRMYFETISGTSGNEPPVLLAIQDDRNAAPVDVHQPVEYFVTFSKAMNAETIDSADFANLGSANIHIHHLSAIEPHLYRVGVTPNTSGTLRLKIPAGATLADTGGQALDTTNPLQAASTITVNGGTPASPFDNWAGNFPALTNPDPALDFDKGGLGTAIEWVLGGDPTDATDDAGLAPKLDTTTDPDGKLLFTYRRRNEARDDDRTSIVVQYGNALAGWTAATHQGNGPDQIAITGAPAPEAPGFEYVTVALPSSLTDTDSLFVRLGVNVAAQ